MRKLSAFELLVMHLVNKKSKGTVLNQSFWTDLYTTDPMKILKRLIEDGIIVEKNDYELTLSKLKNPELKELLRNNNLKVTGNKIDLVKRVIENNLDLSDIYLAPVYLINPEYNKIFEETSFLTEFIYGHEVTLENAYKYYLTHPGKNESEIITGVYIQKLKDFMSSKEPNIIYSIRALNYNISRYFFQNKQIESGFYYLNAACVIDVLLSFNNYIMYQNYGDSILRVNISQNDLIKYRSALSNNQFTLTQLEQDLHNAAKPLYYSENLKNTAVQFMIAYIQDEFIDAKPFIKVLSKPQKDIRNRYNLEVKIDKDVSNYPVDQNDEKKVKKKKRFWIF